MVPPHRSDRPLVAPTGQVQLLGYPGPPVANTNPAQSRSDAAVEPL